MGDYRGHSGGIEMVQGGVGLFLTLDINVVAVDCLHIRDKHLVYAKVLESRQLQNPN